MHAVIVEQPLIPFVHESSTKFTTAALTPTVRLDEDVLLSNLPVVLAHDTARRNSGTLQAAYGCSRILRRSKSQRLSGPLHVVYHLRRVFANSSLPVG